MAPQLYTEYIQGYLLIIQVSLMIKYDSHFSSFIKDKKLMILNS